MHVLDTIAGAGIVSVRDALLARQAAGHRVCRLESGDPSFALPRHIADALERAIRDGHTHYTAGAGIPALREAAASKLVRENRLPNVAPTDVFVTNGAMHGLYVVFRALVAPCLPDSEEVILPDPTWTETADNVTLAGGRPVRVPIFDGAAGTVRPLVGRDAADDEWALRVREAISPRTRAIVVNSPHNPTGEVWTEGQLRALVALAAEHDLWIVSDEAYEHVIFHDARHVSPGSFGYPRVLSIYSMSKSYAMSGLRLGYVVCPAPAGSRTAEGVGAAPPAGACATNRQVAERIAKLLRCTINGVNSATQWAGVAALGGPQDCTRTMAEEYERRRDLLFSGVERLPWLQPVRPAGAFYLWARVNDARWPTGWDLTNHLITYGVGSAPGEVFGPAGRGWVRFAFACPTDQIAEAAERLAAL